MLPALRTVCLLAILGALACSSEEAPSKETPRTAPKSAPSKAKSLPVRREGVVGFEGSCEGAEELGDLARYPLRLRAGKNSLGIVRVRSNGKFIAREQDNVLGEVPSGTLFYGQGPISDPDYGRSRAYRVALQDSEGRLCRGYVSTRVVEFEGRE